MPRPKRSFSPEFRREAVKLVIDESRPIVDVARELGIGEGTLGSWVARYRRDHAGEEPALSVNERERLRQLERETRELRMLVDLLQPIADDKKATPAQIALAWVLAQKPWVVPIPGTTKLHRLKENLGVLDIELTTGDLHRIEEAAANIRIQGARVPEELQSRFDR
jgi:aryl-alcohol dehydrogenase-like predicted oxidoreductase